MKPLPFISIALLLLLSYSCNNSKSNTTATQTPGTTITEPTAKTAPASDLPAVPCALSLSEATPKSIEANYTDAVNTDPTKAAFAGRTHEFVTAFRQMIADFATYLQKNESFEKKNFTYFNRVYFQANGTIDYYFYHLQPGLLTKDQEAIFKKSLNEFIKTYKFPMTAKVPFAQCSPVSIEP